MPDPESASGFADLALPSRFVDVGLRLALRVRDEHTREVRGDVAAMGRRDLEALVIALAECVPVDQPKSALLAWKSAPVVPAVRPLEPCGTVAAARRHHAHGEAPCEACREAERTYYRDRKRIQRAARRGQEVAA